MLDDTEPRAHRDRLNLSAESRVYMERVRSFPGGGHRTILIASGTQVIWDGIPLTVQLVSDTKMHLVGTDGLYVELEIPRSETLVERDGTVGAPEPQSAECFHGMEEIMARASQKDIANANRRCQAVLARIAGQKLPFAVSERSLRRWAARYLEAEKKYGCGYVGLVGQW